MISFSALMVALGLISQGADCGVLRGRYERAVTRVEATATNYVACVSRRDFSACPDEVASFEEAKETLERTVSQLRLFCRTSVETR